MSEINGYKGPADLRDVKAVRSMLAAHIDEQQRHNKLVAERLGIVTGDEPATLAERWHRWLPSLVTTRFALAGYVVITVVSVAGSVAALPVARSLWPVQQVPPHVHETARVEVDR